MFLNYINDNVEGGININGKKIKLIAQADKLILLLSNKLILQKMIVKYCQK